MTATIPLTPHATIWFSGPTARELITALPKTTWEAGCNHILRFRPVDCVVAYDRQMVTSVAATDMRDHVSYYTQAVWQGPGWQSIKVDKHDREVHCSGTLAVEVALSLGYRLLTIIGADFWQTNHSLQDEFYKFRGHTPDKNGHRKHSWLSKLRTRCDVEWIHPQRQAWMTRHQEPKRLLTSRIST